MKTLKKEFLTEGIYEENPEKAEVILFNSHHFLKGVFKLKKKFPEKIFIHRIDGPIGLYRGRDKIIDRIIFKFNNLLADGTVFQSHWSKEQNQKLYKANNKYETVIHNSSDIAIFNRQNKKAFNAQEKIKLIAVSWSSNIKKGFDVYRYLDENLDFSKYEMTFVGNSPVEFKNITHLKPMPSADLAAVLKLSDIYITASQKDPCSNALIEALSCGLPAVALNDGGHTELVQKAGQLFENKQDVIRKIENVAGNYQYYQSQIPEFSIKKSGEAYHGFAQKIYHDAKSKTYQPKAISIVSKLKFQKIKLMFLCSKF